MPWVAVADVEEIEEEDVIEVEVNGRLLAVYRTKEGYFATDGICTHEHAHLADGFVMGNIIECPKHQGRFDVRDGAPKGPPVSVRLCTYALRVEDGTVYVDLDRGSGQERAEP
jgi:3-phenylpropionate/trans-cinnamate dioxygenase ferredoxin component